jgi:hypothetical protein
METLFELARDPAAWAALATLVAMEIVLGIDNLIFISILTNKLPEETREKARRIGIGLALILRLGLLATIAIIVALTEPVFTVFGKGFSWRDMILIAGGVFLVWKATREIHQHVAPEAEHEGAALARAVPGFAAAIGQILVLDLVFSIDSIITAVGMTDHVPIMFVAVIRRRDRDAGSSRPSGQFHQQKSHHRHAGAGVSDHDRHDTDRRRARPSCAQGLHLHGHGVFDGSGRVEHAGAEASRKGPGQHIVDLAH